MAVLDYSSVGNPPDPAAGLFKATGPSPLPQTNPLAKIAPNWQPPMDLPGAMPPQQMPPAISPFSQATDMTRQALIQSGIAPPPQQGQDFGQTAADFIQAFTNRSRPGLGPGGLDLFDPRFAPPWDQPESKAPAAVTDTAVADVAKTPFNPADLTKPGPRESVQVGGVAAAVIPQQPGESDQQYQQRQAMGAGLAVAGMIGPRSLYGEGFYSSLEKTLTEKMPNRATAEQIAGILRGSAVKPDELLWTGFDDFLKSKAGQPVTKQEALDYLAQNKVNVQEVIKETGLPHDPAYVYPPNETKYSSYQTPGGQDYRELLLTLGPKGPSNPYMDYVAKLNQKYGESWQWEQLRPEEQAQMDQLYAQIHSENPNATEQDLMFPETPNDYRSSHFEEPNILAHVRFNDRTAEDGAKTLFLEEVQSDWHDAGTKHGYAGGPYGLPKGYDVRPSEQFPGWFETVNPDGKVLVQAREAQTSADMSVSRFDLHPVPDAPFVAKSWHDLAMKRMLQYAAENGYDRLAWTTGDMQNDRYSLEKVIDTLVYNPKTQTLSGYKYGPAGSSSRFQHVFEREMTPGEISGYVGSELSAKLLDTPNAAGDYMLEGDQMKVGGLKKRRLYDEMLPITVNKIVKKFGGKVGETNVYTGAWDGMQQYLNAGDRSTLPDLSKLPDPKNWVTVHSVDLPSNTRQSIQSQGLPLFGAAAGAGLGAGLGTQQIPQAPPPPSGRGLY